MRSDLENVADATRELLSGRDVARFMTVIDPDIVWGECSGAADVLTSLELANEDWQSIDEQTVSVHDDRVIVRVAGTYDGQPVEIHNAMFVRDGRIYEMRDSMSRADALALRPLTEIVENPPPFMRQAIPVLPVSDLEAAVADYTRLGFESAGDAVGGEVTIESGAVSLRLSLDEESRLSRSTVDLIVSDAAAIFARWHAAGLAGELVMPSDAGDGQMAGAYLDRDENVIRFMSPVNAMTHTP